VPDGTADRVPVPRTPGGLHSRVPGTALAALTHETTGPAPVPRPSPLAVPDIALLIRVRTLLEARL
ncbi:hypothetical protein, partial [Kitasatospora putterlickiae]